jgi:hypothetical protein
VTCLGHHFCCFGGVREFFFDKVFLFKEDGEGFIEFFFVIGLKEKSFRKKYRSAVICCIFIICI